MSFNFMVAATICSDFGTQENKVVPVSMGITDNLTCLLRNLYAGQKARVRTGHGTTDLFQIRKGVYCHPAYLTYIQSTTCEMLGWMKHKLESRFLGEIAMTSCIQRTPHLWQKAKN